MPQAPYSSARRSEVGRVSLTDVVGGPGQTLGSRFALTAYLPTAAGIVTVFLVLAAGAPQQYPTWSRALEATRKLDASDAALLVLGVTLIAVVVQPLQLRLVRLLEGYWGRSQVATTLAGWFEARQEGRRRQLAAAAVPPQAPPRSTDHQREAPPNAVVQADEALRARFPSGALLPTSLGNALRGMEERAGAPYGLDAVVVWPRIYPLLSDVTRATVDDRRDQLDAAARMSVTAGIVALVTLALLWGDGLWLLLPLAAALVSAAAYRAAVAAALAYGESVRVAVELHRFDFLKALHLPLPPSREIEREQNRRLCAFLRQGVPTPLIYEHGPTPRNEKK
jgi:hypothetical protein